MLNNSEKKELLLLARNTIEKYITSGIILSPDTGKITPEMKKNFGAFVTLHNNGRLRGCIGMITTEEPLYKTIIQMAIAAAAEDPRFEPVSADELKDIDIEVSVLSKPEKVNSIDEIELGKHGVIVKKGLRSGVFLPQVAAETGWDKKTFMEQLCAGKAGLEPDAYLKPGTEIFIFTADVFGENNINK